MVGEGVLSLTWGQTTFRNPSKKHCSRSVIWLQIPVINFFPEFWPPDAARSPPMRSDQHGAAEIFKKKRIGLFLVVFLHHIFKHYWSRICGVTDVQYKQQQQPWEWTQCLSLGVQQDQETPPDSKLKVVWESLLQTETEADKGVVTL